MFPLSHDSAAATALAATMAVHSVIHFQNIVGREGKKMVKRVSHSKRKCSDANENGLWRFAEQKRCEKDDGADHDLRAEIQLLKYVQM